MVQIKTFLRIKESAHSIWVKEDPLQKEMATHSSIRDWRIPWTEEPDGLQSMGSQSQTRLKQFSMHAFSSITQQDKVRATSSLHSNWVKHPSATLLTCPRGSQATSPVGGRGAATGQPGTQYLLISLPSVFSYLFLIGGKLIYNVVWVSAIHQHESTTGIHMSPPSEASLPPPTSSHPAPPSWLRAVGKALIPQLLSGFFVGKLGQLYSIWCDPWYPEKWIASCFSAPENRVHYDPKRR